LISFIGQKNSRKPPLDAYVPAVVFVRRCLLFFLNGRKRGSRAFRMMEKTLFGGRSRGIWIFWGNMLYCYISRNIHRWEGLFVEKKLKILITDDSTLLRKKLRLELERLDCEVIEAANGKEAVMLDLQEKPDGMFLDIVMPEVGGIEALQVIREVNPDMPVVMLSSAGTPQKLVETLKLGALDFIQKPYTSEQIKKAVEAIRQKAASDA